MGLSASLNIGRSALTASQLAIQVTGNNFANASTPGYSRQQIRFGAVPDQKYGDYFVGRGVQVLGINRQIDQGLESRLNGAKSDENAANVDQSLITAVEDVVGQLNDNDLSAEFGRFYTAWSELANSPNREGARSLVVQQGRTLANAIRATRSDLAKFQGQADAQLGPATQRANQLLDQIASLNTQITNAEGGTGTANSLRDQRDQVIGQLSELVDVSSVEQPSGAVNILVGSTPVVLNGTSRGIYLKTVSDGKQNTVSVNVKQDDTQLTITSGTIGGLLRNRNGVADTTIKKLDDITSQLIFQVNRIHSQGTGQVKLTSAQSNLTFASADLSRSLADPNNATIAALPFKPTNGSFLVTVTNKQTGASETARIKVDLDGIQNNGQPGTSDDTSVNSLAAQLGGIANLSATVQPDGTLKIDASGGYTVGFSEDSSGALAVLGINTYFTGTNATNIDVRQELRNNSGLLATGVIVAGQPNDNGTSLAIAKLRDQNNDVLGGRSIGGAWNDAAADVGAQAGAAKTRSIAASTVRGNLEAQRNAVSGVDLDEESINLLNSQRQYQGAARFISVVDQLTQTLLGLIGG